jgi:hypothetical protein
MSDQVSITWTDATGVYTNEFLIESPTLEDVKKSFTVTMMMPGQESNKEETPEDFYSRVSFQMINQVMAQVQQNKQHQAMQLVPPITVTPLEAKTKDE